MQIALRQCIDFTFLKISLLNLQDEIVDFRDIPNLLIISHWVVEKSHLESCK